MSLPSGFPHATTHGPAGEIVKHAVTLLNPHPATGVPSERQAFVRDTDIRPIGRTYTPESLRCEVEAKVRRIYRKAEVAITFTPNKDKSPQSFRFTITVTV